MGNGPIYNGEKCKIFITGLKTFCWQNRSKLVDTPSIYAGYTPLGGLLKKYIFSPKIPQKYDVSDFFIYNGAQL